MDKLLNVKSLTSPCLKFIDDRQYWTVAKFSTDEDIESVVGYCLELKLCNVKEDIMLLTWTFKNAIVMPDLSLTDNEYVVAFESAKMDAIEITG